MSENIDAPIMKEVIVNMRVHGKKGSTSIFYEIPVQYDNDLSVLQLKDIIFKKQNTYITTDEEDIKIGPNNWITKNHKYKTIVNSKCFIVTEDKSPWKEFGDNMKVKDIDNIVSFSNVDKKGYSIFDTSTYI